MGRWGNKKTGVALSQSNDDLLSLLRLPNEVLEMILSYLSSSDIVQSFFDLNSDRIQSVIQNYFLHFDLSSIITNEEQWIKTYFVDQSRLLHCLISLRLTHGQMKVLSRSNIQFIQLVALHIVQIKDNTVLQIDLLRMAPSMLSLSLDFLPDEMSHDSIGCLARILFSRGRTWQQQIEKLSINDIHIPFGFHSLQSMPNLHHLTINLRCEDQLFDLCSHLANLESLRVDVRRSSSLASDFSFSPVGVSRYLRRLIISGHFSSPSSLYKFILIYKSSLEYLKLMNIVHPEPVDGHQLQSKLVQHLLSTIRFRFHFQFPVNMQDFCINSYEKTFDWTPVVIDEKIDKDSLIIVVSSSSTQHLQSRI